MRPECLLLLLIPEKDHQIVLRFIPGLRQNLGVGLFSVAVSTLWNSLSDNV